MARSFQKSQHATNYVIFKELVKSLPHLGQKATNLVVIVNKSLHDSLCVSSPYTFLLRAHTCASFDFQGKQNSSVYKIFIFVLLSFRSLFTVVFWGAFRFRSLSRPYTPTVFSVSSQCTNSQCISFVCHVRFVGLAFMFALRSPLLFYSIEGENL